MTPQEIIDLLSICAGFDQRTVGQADVEAWRLALEDPRIPNMAYDECVDAVILHYRDGAEFIKPSHILARVKAERGSAIQRVLPPVTQDPETYARFGEMWREALSASHARTAANRRAVLSHPDLAERLTEPPLGYAFPEQWTGGVPPETANGEHNSSPRREALVALLAEAEQRNRKDGPHG